MPYVQVADPLLNSGKPGRSTDWKQIRDNQDYFNTQINALNLVAAGSNNSIIDDFMCRTGSSAYLGAWWSPAASGGAAQALSEHRLDLTTGGGASGYGYVNGADSYQRIVKSEEYVAICEARIKGPGADSDNYLIGWNDASLSSTGPVSDVSDCIIVSRGGSGTWTGYVANGGSSSSVGPFGSMASWNVVRIEVTCSATAGNRQVEFFLAGVSQGVMTTDANIPSVSLRPILGVYQNSTAALQLYVDYVIYTVEARPLAA